MMNKDKNFKDFYEQTLVPELIMLDRERKKVDRRVILIVLITVIAIIIEAKIIPEDAGDWKFVIQPLTGILGFILISVVSKNYRLNFKNKIISKISTFVDKNMQYTPEGTVPEEEFIRSAIFQHSCDKYKGEDHFRGTLGKTAVEFSEVVAQYVTRTGSGSSRKETYHTFFKGIFFVADFNKHFKTHTIVLPDTAERLFGKMGQKLQSLAINRGELIRLEDPEFEKEFCVYGDDQVEARYILSPSLMQRILEFKRKWNTKVYLSFRDSKVYIAIRMTKNLFETRLFKSVVDYNFIEENMRYLILLTGIVEDLNLNTRIWTKT